MVAQYTAAALVAENRRLAAPASVDSIPTSGMQEDHVSMGWGAALKLRSVLENVRRILAVELVSAARAQDLRRPLKAAPRPQRSETCYAGTCRESARIATSRPSWRQLRS